MRCFDDREDVEEWLEPLGYDAFWEETADFEVTLPSRESCDIDIAAGTVDEATALAVLKTMVRLQIVNREQLRPRDRMMWHSLH